PPLLWRAKRAETGASHPPHDEAGFAQNLFLTLRSARSARLEGRGRTVATTTSASCLRLWGRADDKQEMNKWMPPDCAPCRRRSRTVTAASLRPPTSR